MVLRFETWGMGCIVRHVEPLMTATGKPAADAAGRWGSIAAACQHPVGRMKKGTPAVEL